ncbi:uncharacterized protein A1O9_10104 [Exophiala aquamarina CBS 119918]|uniref:DUF7702 domain-containing protein n=1 Tax=Exophiala aquamarina CBS 119918 TaxID=1182545 RepID=A0A072P0P0_9EURO|nr:uncharacterized protein A1O9_10104 [Exophiala aquamarina CBS 119918]KEF53704.1 hypothetical protein A1O9_10104 [Exophiala aquamarina CBS 119918]
MLLSGFEILAILELIIFTPALFASIVVVYNHGHQKQLGWRFLVMICLFRIIGASTVLASVHHPSSGLTITYDVMNSFGLSAVIYTALGLLSRVQSGLDHHGLPAALFRLLGLPGLAGLILCIIGSVNIFSNDPSDQGEGLTYYRVAMILFLVVFIADVLITIHCFMKISHVQQRDRRILYAVTASIVFMALRTCFSLLCAFANNPTLFSSWSLEWEAILVHGCLGVLMEAIVVGIFLWAGFTTAAAARPASPRRKVGPAVYHEDLEDAKQGP